MANEYVPKRLKSVVKAAQRQGWTYDRTKRGHPRLSPPRGMMDPLHPDQLLAPVTFAQTVGHGSGDRNGIAALRRAGLDL